jgi:hypothetical protein
MSPAPTSLSRITPQATRNTKKKVADEPRKIRATLETLDETSQEDSYRYGPRSNDDDA